MATYFSNHFSTDGARPGEANPAHLVSSSISNTPVRYKRAAAIQYWASGDTIRLFSLKPTDRLLNLYVTTTAGVTSGACSFFLYQAGRNHDGRPVGGVGFITGSAFTSALNRVDQMPAGIYRGATLEAIAVGFGATAAQASEGVLWDIRMDFTAGSASLATLVVEAYYTSAN